MTHHTPWPNHQIDPFYGTDAPITTHLGLPELPPEPMILAHRTWGGSWQWTVRAPDGTMVASGCGGLTKDEAVAATQAWIGAGGWEQHAETARRERLWMERR
jgi:hypothetical protein